MMKSQQPFRSRPGSTSHFNPAKSEERDSKAWRGSSNTGAMLSSDLAVSLPLAMAMATPSRINGQELLSDPRWRGGRAELGVVQRDPQVVLDVGDGEVAERHGWAGFRRGAVLTRGTRAWRGSVRRGRAGRRPGACRRPRAARRPGPRPRPPH